ncbi:hypothetical protein PVAG01_07644 [Phlyctema vagabunda]|uniref:Fumarylacetoacetate hydrolase n=1 Tax=Phlyctema vagabunda TaxID=108571 RepID=A0ABR4PD46_9HELO
MSTTEDQHGALTNYIAYEDPDTQGNTRIGSLNFEQSVIQPLSFVSGTPISNLYQVIEVGESQIKATGETLPLSEVKILAPISGRDILAVGKNYSEHAKEFNSSGYDASDKVDQPTHPVIFTKRATSIIANGEPIFLHDGFTDTLDYEGEIGVIIGKSGFKISEVDASDYVWGYTIINDLTARERQRDHKQFFIGKSADTLCPMGPIAVPAKELPEVLRVQTHVNGEKRQDSTIQDLIFSVPFLIKILSEGMTLQAGDVIATGTPAGVGIGRTPPVFLKHNDVIEVSISGLGTLKNTVSRSEEHNRTLSKLVKTSNVPMCNMRAQESVLASLDHKKLNYKHIESASGSPIIFIHGLGSSSEYFSPLIANLALTETHSLHLMDLEGHGLSPTSAVSVLSISSFADDFHALASSAHLSQATIIAHDLGCSIAMELATRNPDFIAKLILLGPLHSSLPSTERSTYQAMATAVRRHGMSTITNIATSPKNYVATSAVRMALLGQDVEGYAKACTAIAEATEISIQGVIAKTLVVAGSEDKISPVSVCEDYAYKLGSNAQVKVLEHVGHWHIFEDLDGVSEAIKAFL